MAIKILMSGFGFYKNRSDALKAKDIIQHILSVRMNYTITQRSMYHVGGAYMTLLIDKYYEYLMREKYAWMFIGAEKVH